jgi:hypothetical protein
MYQFPKGRFSLNCLVGDHFDSHSRRRHVPRRRALASETLNNSGHVAMALPCRFRANNGHSIPKKKPPEGSSQSILMMVDQPAINTGFDFRRYAIKAVLLGPRIVVA